MHDTHPFGRQSRHTTQINVEAGRLRSSATRRHVFWDEAAFFGDDGPSGRSPRSIDSAPRGRPQCWPLTGCGCVQPKARGKRLLGFGRAVAAAVAPTQRTSPRDGGIAHTTRRRPDRLLFPTLASGAGVCPLAWLSQPLAATARSSIPLHSTCHTDRFHPHPQAGDGARRAPRPPPTPPTSQRRAEQQRETHKTTPTSHPASMEALRERAKALTSQLLARAVGLALAS